jgi:hypothetical protein
MSIVTKKIAGLIGLVVPLILFSEVGFLASAQAIAAPAPTQAVNAQTSKIPARLKRTTRKRFVPPANRPPVMTRGSGTR